METSLIPIKWKLIHPFCQLDWLITFPGELSMGQRQMWQRSMGFSYCSGKVATFWQDERRDWLGLSCGCGLPHQLKVWGTSEPVLLGSLVCCLLVWIFLEKCSWWLSTMQLVLLPCFFFKMLAPAAISFWSSLVCSLWRFLCVRDHYHKRFHHATLPSVYNTV